MMRRILAFLAVAVVASCTSGQDWRTASRESAGIAPDPAETREAVLHVYGADTWGWRGWFAIHTWIAAKRTGESVYTIYEVIGWRASRGIPVVRVARDLPDRHWFGARPRLLPVTSLFELQADPGQVPGLETDALQVVFRGLARPVAAGDGARAVG